MQYIYFKHLKIVNFLSIGKKPVEINFTPGLNIITGRNFDKADRANMVGKSAIADAIHFALYGETIRELPKKDFVINDQFPNDICMVELEFTYQHNNQKNECKIVRTLNPTKCFLYINGVDESRSSVVQTTELIIDTIKTTPDVFQHCVILTVNNTVPFMAQKKVEKRKFIEGILGLEIFGNMLLQARSDYNDTKKNIDIETTKYDEVDRSLVAANKQKDTYEETKKKRMDILVTRQRGNEQAIATLNADLKKQDPVDDATYTKLKNDCDVAKNTSDVLGEKLTAIRKLLSSAELAVEFNTKRLKSLKRIDSKCPNCGKDLAEEANTQYEKDKTTCDQEISKNSIIITEQRGYEAAVSEDHNKAVESYTKLSSNLSSFALRKKEIENINERIKQLTNWQQQLVVDIDQLNKDSTNFQDTITGIQTRQNEIKTIITSLQEKLDVIENAKFITSEEGVKSFIVKKILQVLNARLTQYLRRLESNSIVTFNEFFEETVTNERGKECSYFNFSGAERKAIDLAILFTFQDVRRAQADVWLNLSMFDELLDSSLDEKGIELVLDILKERVDNYNEAIYIISHRKESKKYCSGGEFIFLEKKNGITTRSTNYELTV